MDGSPSVRNCRFIANTALAFGGGIHMDGSSAPVLTDCVFSGNSATDGGGLNSDNSSPRIVGCTFTTNAACSYNADGGSGGGLYNYKSGSIIMNCTFAGNTSDEWGGAGGLRNKESNVVIANCTFTDNWGGSGGGLVNSWSEMVLANCTFVGNSTLGQGGAIVNGGQGQADVRNCILWGNSPNEIAGESPQVSWSNVQGGWAGAGNITVEPGFADPAAGDYHLKSQAGRWEPKSQSWVTDETTSPCIDAGDPMSLIGYEAFPNGGVVNMGAYGGTGEASKSYFGEPVCEKIAAGDINGDCKVNFGDFAIMALHWLEDNNQ
jgi:predicted outer membrane repeat protein